MSSVKQPAPRIFVSHHHGPEEDVFTRRLVADLEAAGADVWVDDKGITSDDFVQRISDGLAGRQWLILVMTPAALASSWVRREVNAALNEHAAGRMLGVIPVVMTPCRDDDIPVLWRTLHRYDATHNFPNARDALLRTLGLALPAEPAPTSAQQPLPATATASVAPSPPAQHAQPVQPTAPALAAPSVGAPADPTPTQALDRYQMYVQQRQSLLTALYDQVDLLLSLNMTTAASNMRSLAERTALDTFKVMVVGEFNRGKSTLINALLGKKVLPAYAVPTTAIITEIRWGEEPRAYLYHLQDGNGGEQRIEPIPIDDLEKYVVADEGDGEKGKPYEKVVLEWPLELCRDGVELVDSPSLGADLARERITHDYLTQADAVVFVTECDFPMSKAELETVAHIRTLYQSDIFFVCTRIDLVEEEEQALVKKRLVQLLAPPRRGDTERVYLVNALGGIQARTTHDVTLWQASGVPQMEHALKDYLATARMPFTLVRPAYELQDSVQQARQGIREEEKLAQQTVQELQRRYDEAQQPLHALSTQLQDISSRINIFRANLQRDVEDRARAFFRDLANQPKSWIVGFTPENSIGLTGLFSSEKRDALVKETAEHLSGKARARYEEWLNAVLLPLVKSEMQNRLALDTRTRIMSFDAALTDVQVGLTGVELKTAVAIGEQRVPLWERAVGGVSGLPLGAFDATPILPNAEVRLGVAVAGSVLDAPIFITRELRDASAIQVRQRGPSETERIVNGVAERFAEHIEKDRDTLAANVKRAIDEQVAQVQDKVEQILHAELNSFHERVVGVLAEKLHGRESAEERQRNLRRIEAALDAQDRLVANLSKEFALTK